MIRKAFSVAAIASILVGTTAAAQVPDLQELGARRSGATAGAYFRLPLGRGGVHRSSPQFGVRVSSVHDYRDARAPTAPVYRADALDLRLSGPSGPTLLLAGQPTARRGAERLNLNSVGTIAAVGGGVLLLLLVAAAAGGGGFADTCPTVGGSRDHCINP